MTAIRVERYSMGPMTTLVLGEPYELTFDRWTMRAFEADRIIVNAPERDFVMLSSVIVDGIDVLYDDRGMPVFKMNDQHECDSFDLFNDGVGQNIKSRFCDHGISVRGRYTGSTPKGFVKGQKFTLCVTLQGPAGGLPKEAR